MMSFPEKDHGSLPDNWTSVTLEEIAKIKYGKNLPTGKFTESGYKVFGANGVIGRYRDYMYESPQVLISCRGANSGTINFSPPQSFVTNNSLVLELPDTMDHVKRYVYYALQAVDRSGIVTGTAQPQVTITNVKDLRIPLAPWAEQKRIVKEIEKQFTRRDAAVANLKRIQANLERYKASVLKAACEGRLVPQEADLNPDYEPAHKLLERILEERRRRWEEEEWQKQVERAKKKVEQADRKEAGLPYYFRDMEPEDWMDVPKEEYREYLPKTDRWKEKYEEPETPDTDELPKLPEGWVWANMQTITVEGPSNGLYLPQSKYGSGTPILRIDDYQNGSSRAADELQEVDAKPDEIRRYSLAVGDLVINRVNSPSHLGKCLVVEDRNLPSLFESNMMRLRLSDDIDPYFVELYLRSTPGRMRLIKNAKWAVNQASINQEDVGNTPLPLPPLLEQKRIVARAKRLLSIGDSVSEEIDVGFGRSERLRQSILQRAFSGKLVPQDPDDEPASALLKRIRSTEKQGEMEGDEATVHQPSLFAEESYKEAP